MKVRNEKGKMKKGRTEGEENQTHGRNVRHIKEKGRKLIGKNKR